MSVVRLAGLALLAVACSSPAPASRPSVAADEQAIAKAVTEYVAAMKSNDPVKIASWWTDDAVLIDRASPTVRGRAALDTLVRSMFAAARLTDATLVTEEIAVSGDLGYFIGRYDESFQPQTGAALHNRGRLILVWKRQPDGSWKIARNVGTDLPST